VKDWEILKRPNGQLIIRFNKQYLLDYGKEGFWALAESFRKENELNDVVAGSNEIAFFIKSNSSFNIDEELIAHRFAELKRKGRQFKKHNLLIKLKGEDYEYCIKKSGLSEQEWVKLFLKVEFVVGLMGFIPYFSYLENLPESLKIPRRTIARTKVKKGSLAIGGDYVGVYPQETPGGWNLIGECLELQKLKLFNLGDRVKFVLAGDHHARS
jgi:5-oxoprolinase (ATP-hydrolysing) subunit B